MLTMRNRSGNVRLTDLRLAVMYGLLGNCKGFIVGCEKFEDAYNVFLIFDDREQFVNHSSRSSRMSENIYTINFYPN